MNELIPFLRKCVNGNFVDITENGAGYWFEESGDHLNIYFEGTKSVQDWMTDFSFRKKPYKEMETPFYVHGGFLKYWKLIDDAMILKISELNSDGSYKWKSIGVYGYSMGAALAGLCHELVWFYREDLRNGGLAGYGFECPRFYASLFVNPKLKERWAGFHVTTNHDDIVPHLPLKIMGFCHVSKPIRIGRFLKTNCFESHLERNVEKGLSEP